MADYNRFHVISIPQPDVSEKRSTPNKYEVGESLGSVREADGSYVGPYSITMISVWSVVQKLNAMDKELRELRQKLKND